MGREVHVPVEAVGERRLAAPRPSGAAGRASAAVAGAGQVGTGRTAAGPFDGVLRDVHEVRRAGGTRQARGDAVQDQEPVSGRGVGSRAPAQLQEGLRTPARSPAAPGPPAGPPDLAGSIPTAGSSPQGSGSGSLPGVAGQLVRVLAAPQPLADGSTTVTVTLDPPSLGMVKATVVAGTDHLAVQLVTSTAAGAEALRIGLPELKNALSSSGQQVQVTVTDGSPSTSDGLSSTPQGGGGRQSPSTSPHHPPASPPPRPPSRPVPTARRTTALRIATSVSSSHLVDIRI